MDTSASSPMYDSKDNTYFEDPRSEMLPFLPPHAATMLEVGSGTAAFAASVKAGRALHVTVIEPFAAAAEVAQRRVDRVIVEPIETAVKGLLGERFDCVLLNDVLEHLVDPWAVLRDLRPLVAPGGCVVASIPNVRYWPVFFDYVVGGHWNYRGSGVLDRTHLRFFTRNSLASLFASSGFSLDKVEGINPNPLSWRFRLLNTLLAQRLEDTLYKQFACVASPSAAGSP
jgi:2-polyprenyl-3-methyl-5-hydroxy-6-metoxy-1,4-benzoquinol methylase